MSEIIYVYIYTDACTEGTVRMGSKNISLKKSAYERLASLKGEEESFSDVVERLTRDRTPKYSDLEGILSKGTVRAIEDARRARKSRDKAEFRKLADQFEEDEG